MAAVARNKPEIVRRINYFYVFSIILYLFPILYLYVLQYAYGYHYFVFYLLLYRQQHITRHVQTLSHLQVYIRGDSFWIFVYNCICLSTFVDYYSMLFAYSIYIYVFCSCFFPPVIYYYISNNENLIIKLKLNLE